jgi:hypothetical protein
MAPIVHHVINKKKKTLARTFLSSNLPDFSRAQISQKLLQKDESIVSRPSRSNCPCFGGCWQQAAGHQRRSRKSHLRAWRRFDCCITCSASQARSAPDLAPSPEHSFWIAGAAELWNPAPPNAAAPLLSRETSDDLTA